MNKLITGLTFVFLANVAVADLASEENWHLANNSSSNYSSAYKYSNYQQPDSDWYFDQQEDH